MTTTPVPAAGADAWPTLSYAAEKDTYETLHLWAQIVGKIRLARAPMVNHWWQVPLYVTARGLGTSAIPANGGAFEMEFDVIDHALHIRSSGGEVRDVALRPRTVADFHRAVMRALDELGLSTRIWTMPVEIPGAIRFERDDVHASYDPDAAHRLWRALVRSEHVLQRFRGRFIGKASPVHFFWGSFDLAATRFSGRRAPPHPGGNPTVADWVMREAYSHEESSAGFWPGGAGMEEAAYYAYAYPEPEGFRVARVAPSAANYVDALGEFVLPYEAVRSAPDPDAMLMEFLESTYAAAADLAHWDRASLERAPAAH
ncbi:MAG TPA: DUF5996 family protein [Gemmatimonadaceae bacterium]|nr:DUF5996 family protein [Gemmatimonadaceae bacterium]